MYWYFVKNIITYRYTAFKHFMIRNNTQEKIKGINKYDENLPNDYNIIERVLVEIYDHDTKSSIIKTFKLIDYIGEYEGRDSKVLEYTIYILFKKRKNREDVIPENIFNVSILVNIF